MGSRVKVKVLFLSSPPFATGARAISRNRVRSKWSLPNDWSAIEGMAGNCRGRRCASASHRAGEKRIGHPLLADARARAVAADETDIVAERQQLVGNRLDQRGATTAGNVAAPDRAVEQHVADMGKMHFLVVKYHAARRSAGLRSALSARRAARRRRRHGRYGRGSARFFQPYG